MSKQSTIDQYVKHALQIIRVSNGLNGDASAILRKLARDLRSIFLGEDLQALSLRKLKPLVAQADDLIYGTFKQLTGMQSDAVRELIDVEAQWAVKVGRYSVAADEAALAKAADGFTVVGNTIEEQMTQFANKFHVNMVSQLRLGATAGQSDAEIVARIVGTGKNFTGGALDTVKRDVRWMTDGTTHAAADLGRRQAMEANGINALRWHAILDPSVCPSCAERDGKVWTIDGEPLGDHDIPYASPILHPWCRCILIPLKISQQILDRGIKPTDNFGTWLEKLSPDEQDSVLGLGRAELWREGKITTSDLIGQNGLTLTLKELRDGLAAH